MLAYLHEVFLLDVCSVFVLIYIVLCLYHHRLFFLRKSVKKGETESDKDNAGVR